jgi:uncharacterized membrane protein
MEITEPKESLIGVSNLVYGLHALSIAIGLLSAWTVVGAFVFGIPSIIAVIINYVKQDEARGSWLESHFRWQIRTFWFALAWCVAAALFAVTIIGFPIAWLIFIGVGLWVIYRIVRGWITVRDRLPMPV